MSNNEVINAIIANSQPCIFESENDKVIIDIREPIVPLPETILRRVLSTISCVICCFTITGIVVFIIFQGPGYIIAMEANDDH